MSLPLPSSLHRIGLADDTEDIHYVHTLMTGAGIKSGGGEGSRVWGYTILVDVSEREAARALIVQSHRFRTGDLHVFMLEHPGPSNRKWHKDDLSAMLEWRGASPWTRRFGPSPRLLR